MSDPLLTARRALYTTAFLRALATGAVGILLGVHLARSGLTAGAIGTVVSAGLAGAATAAVAATFFGDRIGRRRLLLGLSALGVVGLALFLVAEGTVALALAAFLGMLNGMGKDRGAALILEQSALPATTTDQERTRVFASYSVMQDVGHALGAILATLPAWLARAPSVSLLDGSRVTLAATGLLGLVAFLLYARAGGALDLGSSPRAVISPQSRRLLTRISALFAIDSLAGGFLTTALLSYFFFERFGAGEAAIGALFFGARLLNAASHFGAAWLARRIGLVNTMVWTHIPSSLLLVTVAFAPDFRTAALLFLLREGLVEMDVPTRQSYVLAVVAPAERTFASGLTNLVRLASWAVAPAFAGLLMRNGSYAWPLIIGAGMKISYDLLLWRAFRSIQPPEERSAAASHPRTLDGKH